MNVLRPTLGSVNMVKFIFAKLKTLQPIYKAIWHNEKTYYSGIRIYGCDWIDKMTLA